MRMSKALKNVFVAVLAGLVLFAGIFYAYPVFADEQADGSQADVKVIVDNGIPVVYINIDESRGTIDAMNSSSDHSVYCYGDITIDVPEGFRYSDYSDINPKDLENVQMSIRGRGNSTWNHAKKPYKIKLDSKSKVLGLPKNKHWALLANVEDQTLIRDRITGWLGDQMGFDFTPRGVPVDVVMTGEEFGTKYLGSYYLTENVRVDDNRVNIAELKETDTDPDIITGGYLLQNAYQLRLGSPDRFFTSRGVEWGTNTPSFDTGTESAADQTEDKKDLEDGYKNKAQQEYIQNHTQLVEDILYNATTEYRDYIDIESSAKYWLVQQFSKNQDAYATGSTYLYKDRDNGNVSKFYWGPLWDFDFAWTYNYITTGMDAGHKWLYPMFYDRKPGNLREAIRAEWPKMRDSLIRLIEDGGVIDGYYEETKASADANHEALSPDSEFNYKNEIEKLKQWIRDRIDWFDENLDEMDNLVHKATYIVDGEVYCYDFLTNTDYLKAKSPIPEKEGYTFLGWMEEDGSMVEDGRYLPEDATFTAKFVPDDSMTHGADIAFSKASDIVKFGPFYRGYQIPYTIIPTDAQDQDIIWTSSDVHIATVDNTGHVIINKTGVVTFTGKLRLGQTRQFTLTIVEMNDEYPVPESIYPVEERIELAPGGQGRFVIETNPSPAKINAYVYESDDETVATVGENGVITAVGPGITKVRVTATGSNADGEDVTFEAEITVVVTEAEEETTTDTGSTFSNESTPGTNPASEAGQNPEGGSSDNEPDVAGTREVKVPDETAGGKSQAEPVKAHSAQTGDKDEALLMIAVIAAAVVIGVTAFAKKKRI